MNSVTVRSPQDDWVLSLILALWSVAQFVFAFAMTPRPWHYIFSIPNAYWAVRCLRRLEEL